MAVRIEQRAEPIPGYYLIDRLGGGGFGEVWRAEAPGGLHKAIKFVFGDLSSAGNNGQRAEQELKALKRVQSVRHPYILTLERYDIIDGQLMIVMELADRNLWDRFKECRAQGLPGIPREELLGYMEESAEALDLMNREYQLQHLDIKPQNLFLVHNHVKVADFGLVKDLESSQASVTGGITPVYAAPETFDGKVTRFSDQYSLAIVYQELLTGQRPFNGTSVRQLILQHLQAEPNVTPLPQADRPHILRSLAKIPNDRFPTCRELVSCLRAASAGATPTSPTSQGLLLAGQATIMSSGPSGPPLSSSMFGPWEGIQSLESGASEGPAPLGETPSGQGLTQNIRAISPSVLRVREEADKVRAPQEITGPGSLFPALVIGLGQMGLTVLQRAREIIHAYASPPGQLPNIRFLLLDTDPEVMRNPLRCNPSTALSASETLVAPLNRPSHYLKPRDGRPALESWLNPRMLYRIPRSQVTTGVRSLGRLAFIDNYRSIIRRLQLELDTILDLPTLQSTARASGLGLRTTRPRVYIVTSLGGGTGSGMFIDLAYNVRALLQQMGYDSPDVVGVLLLPPVDNSRTRLLPLGNTYAALTELKYYAAKGTTFRARYHDREAPIEDSEPPFTRTVVLPLPDESEEVATREIVDLCGQMLYRDLATPFGKAADLGRAGLPAPPWDERGQYVQTFGMFQLSWPRHRLLQSIARELCRRLVTRWLSKDSKPIREAVQQWVQEQWAYLELGADTFIERLQTDLAKSLGRPVEALFDKAFTSLEARQSAQGESPGTKPRGKPEPLKLTREQVADCLQALEELVGKPEDDLPGEPPRLMRLLREAADRLGCEWSQKLVELPVKLIEDPRFRLAGAEEAIRLIVTNVEQTLQHHEPLARDLSERALAAHDHLRVASGGQPREGAKLSPKTPEQIVELCKQYPKLRFQYLVLHHLSAAFVSLRGHLSDELREVNFCRVRLTELLRLLEEQQPGEPLSGKTSTSKEGGIGRVLFVSGCKDLSEAVRMYLDEVDTEHLLELDFRMEDMLRTNFTALVHVCLAPQSALKPLEKAMVQTATDHVAAHLPATSVANLFFEQHPEEQAENEAMDLYHQAVPELPLTRQSKMNTRPVELCVLASPSDPAGERFVQMLTTAMPEVEFQPAVSREDIVIYRERVNLAMTDLEHLGPVGHDAYVRMSSAEHFTPHARCDVDFRQ